MEKGILIVLVQKLILKLKNPKRLKEYLQMLNILKLKFEKLLYKTEW